MTNHTKYIVITGATKGLGRATAELFASKGWTVAVCARTTADLEAMQANWASRFPTSVLHTYAADMSKKPDVQDFARMVEERLDHVDILVNNAGLFLPGRLSDEREGTLETLLEVNLMSAYHVTRALLPRMRARREGHIFNMCSVASKVAYPYGGSYSVAKFALLGFSKALREELKPDGIKVTSIMPGATWSDSWSGVDFPEDRLMPADDIAKAIWGAYDLSAVAVVEELLIRPQLGDV
jgi:short-subunit dehydrogenase